MHDDRNPPLVGKPPLLFTATQRRELANLQVVPEQIEALESALPICRAVMQNPATMTAVRDELNDLAAAMEFAAQAMSRLEAARDYQPAVREVLNRVFEATAEMQKNFENFDGETLVAKALLPLTRAQACVDHAIKKFRAVQRRPTSPWWPVRRIHEALVSGWGRAYYPIRHGDEVGGPQPIPSPPFPHVPSVGITTKPFRRVVGICYDVILERDGSDPERQIREFCAWDRRRQKRGSASDGQQVPGESDLLS